MKLKPLNATTAILVIASSVATATAAQAAVVANPTPSPQCAGNTAFFNPGLSPNIVLPPGFTASVFVAGLNAPTGIAFRGDANNFEVYVLESGHGIPSICNDQSLWPGGEFASDNPFTPDILVFNKNGRKIRGPIGKPTPDGGGFQPEGPAIDLAFVQGFSGGRLFATDSNQSTHQHNGNNNSSRIVIVNPMTGQVTPFITNLPTGDHPTEQLAFKDGWIYWSQGSTTNSGVVGLDNGSGQNQSDIPCQDITLSQNTFASGNGIFTSGYSPFGVTNPGGTVPAFFNSFTGQVRQGVCDGAILRAQLSNPNNIQAFSWGYRNPYAIRFPPKDHPLYGGILAGMDGGDERGNRPSNNAPDELHLGRQNPDGSPDYHGWPDSYGGLPTSQAVYNPIGGPNDDVCPPPFSQAT
jgi:glucose/arabinose dehydrogenase